MIPKVLIISGYGINCEEELKFAFEKAGAIAEIVHIRDLIDKKKRLEEYQILAIPGGFSFGDDTGSGKAFANLIKNHLWDDIVNFIEKKSLVLGICNGFQVLVSLGLLPAIDKRYGETQVALEHNDSARYTVRWVDLKVENNKSPWLKDLTTLCVPIAHGEGRFFSSSEILEEINKNNLIAFKYFKGEMCNYQNLEANPNGALEDIAGITDVSGKILGIMPHPERAIFFTQRPDWSLLKEKLKREGQEIPEEADGIKIFKNAVDYFKEE